MSDSPEPTGNEPELPRRGFMAKAGAVTAAVAATPFLTRLTLAQAPTAPQPQRMPATPGQIPQVLKLAKPRLNLQIRVPEDLEVTTKIERVPAMHKFADNLNGAPRWGRIDLTTARTAATIRDPGSIADDDTCCCVRG